MAFRLNRHDDWLEFCRLHQGLIAEISLPQAIVYGEDRFRDLLRDGSAAGCGVKAVLSELSDSQWAALERFALVFFHECESCAPLDLFPAFRREAERRNRREH
jgi:hypothetical protein